MNNNDKKKGQTLIETVLMMVLLFMFFFGIAEIARAWWFKGQLNNAGRVGARVAAVTPSITLSSNRGCASSDPIVSAVCNSITNQGLRDSAHVSVSCDPAASGGCAGCVSGSGTCPSSGDTITVTVSGTFKTVVPGLAGVLSGVPGWSGTPSLIPGQAASGMTLTTLSVMRHE